MDSKIEEQITCPICCDPYKSPVFVPCGHTFCQKCMKMWLNQNSTCPVCKKRVSQSDVKPNFLVENIMEVLTKKNDPKFCADCEGTLAFMKSEKLDTSHFTTCSKCELNASIPIQQKPIPLPKPMDKVLAIPQPLIVLPQPIVFDPPPLPLNVVDPLIIASPSDSFEPLSPYFKPDSPSFKPDSPSFEVYEIPSDEDEEMYQSVNHEKLQALGIKVDYGKNQWFHTAKSRKKSGCPVHKPCDSCSNYLKSIKKIYKTLKNEDARDLAIKALLESICEVTKEARKQKKERSKEKTKETTKETKPNVD